MHWDWNYTISFSGSQALGLYWNQLISSPGPVACQFTLQILGLARLYKYMSQYLIINLHTLTSYCWDMNNYIFLHQDFLSYPLSPASSLCLKYSPPTLHFHGSFSSLNSLIFLSPQKKPSLNQVFSLSPFIPVILSNFLVKNKDTENKT